MKLSVICAAGFLVAACGQPFFQSSQPKPPPEPRFPRAVKADEVQTIRFWRTPCFGRCPIYDLLFQRTGNATYCGREFVLILGSYAARMDSTAFADLAAFIVKKGFFEFRRNYARPITDQASIVIEAMLSDTNKTVVDYGDYGPAALRSIEAAIDSVGARLPWGHSTGHECAAT